MATIGGDRGISGPLVGGGRPPGIVDSIPISQPRRPTPRGPATGASRTQQRISQAGGNFPGTAAREAARRATTPRRRPAPPARVAGAAPRRPRAQAAPGGVPVTRVPTAVPTRVPRPTNVIQQGPSRPDTRQLLQQEQERRDRIRQGRLFRATQGLRGR